MFLGSDIAATLPELQVQAESLMQDRIRVEVFGDPVFSPSSGATSRPVLSTPYEGKARVQAVREPAQALTADEQVAIQRYVVSVPVSVTGLAPDQVVTVLESADPDLEGRTLLFKSVQGGTFVTSRRLVAVDQQ